MAMLPSQTQHCTTRQADRLLGISVCTAQLWVDNGTLKAGRTPGGHRRVLRTSVETLRQARQPWLPPTEKPIDLSRFSVDILLVGIGTDVVPELRNAGRTLGISMSLNPMATVFDALLEIGRHPPDIVLADIGLPGVNGASFLQSLARSRYGDYVTLGGIVPVDSSMPAPEATTQIRLLRFPLDAVEVRALCDAVPTPRGERPSKERIPYENSTVSG